MATNIAYRNRVLDQQGLNLLRATTPQRGTFKRKVAKLNPHVVRRDIVFSSPQLEKARARRAKYRKAR